MYKTSLKDGIWPIIAAFKGWDRASTALPKTIKEGFRALRERFSLFTELYQG
jgi:hypothetical protein